MQCVENAKIYNIKFCCHKSSSGFTKLQSCCINSNKQTQKCTLSLHLNCRRFWRALVRLQPTITSAYNVILMQRAVMFNGDAYFE